MGVPLIVLSGSNHVSRVGVSQMSNLGLPEFIARDTSDYVNIAVTLANDLPRLTALRAGLRERLKKSPLMNVPRFTKNLEEAYQAMWKTYLGTQTT
jgi:predicted O-linked N-acetylglucosamine transferase (SPINDLY family)